MITRAASCQCGQLNVTCEGDPVRVSVCHCLDCQKRSGSAFAAQARFPAEAITICGRSHQWSRVGDEGGGAVFDFCPDCGSTLFYRNAARPDLIAVAIGAFGDPAFPTPSYSVYEGRRHDWVAITGDDIEHID